MSGKREVIVFVIVAVLLVASVGGLLKIADVRRDDSPYKVVTVQKAVGDWDGDGIPDAIDKCPTRPETFNGFQDQDGCPDIVTHTRAS